MEDSLKVIFNIIDYKEKNRYCSIKFENLSKELYKIDSNKITMDLYPNKEDARVGKIDEVIYIIPEGKNYEEKKFNITLFLDIVNIYNLEVNGDGNCALEITTMWDVDYSVDPTIKERDIPDIKYDGKESKNYEKLYERKRWNFLNAKVENFGGDLFSQKTLEFIKERKNQSFKYDILIRDEKTYNRFLTEKIYKKKLGLLSASEKKALKDDMNKLISQIKAKNEKLDKINDNQKQLIELGNISDFIKKNFNEYKRIEKVFDPFNKRWSLDNFSEEDFDLFLIFSELQILYNVRGTKSRKNISFGYNETKNKIIGNKTINLIEKVRMICGLSKFYSYKLKGKNFPEPVFVEELEKDDKFKTAIESFKKVINSLEESSGFFKKLLMNETGASEILNEWDLEEITIENMINIYNGVYFKEYRFKDFKDKLKSKNEISKEQIIEKLSFPMLSMLTLDQIKKHSLELIPTFFFKISNIYDFNAITDVIVRVTFFNESKILQYEIIECQNEFTYKECTLPLMIEISHEIFSHLIIRYSDSGNKSPLLNPIKDKNKFLCSDDFNAEAGYVIEYFFSENYDDLKKLKTPNSALFELTKPEYWTWKNFNKMKEFSDKNKQPQLYFNSLWDSVFDRRNRRKARCFF